MERQFKTVYPNDEACKQEDKITSNYKVDELRNIGKLFDINIMNEKGKKKTKHDLYIEINNNI